MNVIAKTDKTYLVEMTGQEIALCGGYKHYTEVKFWQKTDYYPYEASFPIGTTIEVTKSFTYIQRLREAEEKVKSSEAILRGLADMLHAALPTTIIAPEKPDE